ncbi:MAG: CHAP domain-containing protein [Lachnospiraceae bacterium]
MKKIKKLISMLICMVLVLSSTMIVHSASNPYPTTQNVDGDAYYEIPCTWFAWQQAYDNLGIALPAWGNAVNWFSNAQAAGYSTGSIPKANSIAVWSGNTYGHVAYVTAVSGGNTFTVNEGGRTDLDHTSSHGVAYGYQLTNAVGQSRPYDPGKTLLGFIYLTGSPSVSLSWSNSDCQYDTTNAYMYIEADTNVRGSFTEAGITVWNEAGGVVGTKSENPGITGTHLNVWYNLTNELGIVLQPGTTYKYQFHIVFNGQRYKSSVMSFRTKGVNPNPSPEPSPSPKPPVYGDIDDDGYVTAADALCALRHAAQLTVLEGDAFLAADVNGDQQITAADALYILQKAAQMINTFPVETTKS